MVETSLGATDVVPVSGVIGEAQATLENEGMDAEMGITVYHMLGRMPFLDRLELSYLYGISSTTCHRYLDLMERAGFVGWFEHATRYLRNSRRYYLTGRGMDLLSSVVSGRLRDVYPVSRVWRRSFIQRMDSMASIYRFAASLAVESGMAPVYVNNCLRGPWDAFIEFPNGVMAGVLRQGNAMSRYVMRDRFWRMSVRSGGVPPLTFVITSDDLERKEAVKRLEDYMNLPSLAVCELDVLSTHQSGGGWAFSDLEGRKLPASRLTERIKNLTAINRGFSEYWEWTARDRRVSFNDDWEIVEESPAFKMTSSEKRFLDIVHEWPLSSRFHFMSMMNVSPSRLTKIATTLTELELVSTVRVPGSGRKRYALTDEGVTYLCRRDRVEVKAKLNRLSVEKRSDGEFRGRSVRAMAREIKHNDGLNYLLDRLWSDPRGGWKSMMTIPTHRSRRRFIYEKETRYVVPDATVELESDDGLKISLMVEYERRAKYSGNMLNKIMPYRCYFDSEVVYSDCEGIPLVLFVFGSIKQETSFVRSVWRDIERSGVKVPFLCTTDDMLRASGPMENVWRVAWIKDRHERVRLVDISQMAAPAVETVPATPQDFS